MDDPKHNDALYLKDAPTLNSALLEVAKNGRCMEVEDLLAATANPKANKFLALCFASLDGHLVVAKLLLPVSEPKAGGSSAVRYAAKTVTWRSLGCLGRSYPRRFQPRPGCPVLSRGKTRPGIGHGHAGYMAKFARGATNRMRPSR